MLKDFLEGRFSAEVVEAPSGNRAASLLEGGYSPDCIVSDFRMADGDGVALLRRLRQGARDIPFIMCSADAPETIKGLAGERIHAFVQKPDFVEPLARAIGLIAGAGSAIATPRYLPVRPSVLGHLRKAGGGDYGFPVFLRLGADNYVRINAEDIERYAGKGVKEFFVSVSEFETLFARVLQALARAGASQQGAAAVSASIDLLEVLADVTRALGMSERTQSIVTSAIDATLKAVTETPKLEEVFRTSQMVSDTSYVSGHSVLLTYVATALALQLKLPATSVQALAFAAFFHDLTLTEDRLARCSDVEELESPADIAVFVAHPSDAAGLLKLVRDHPREAVEVVLRHHERPDGTGFPGRLNADDIGLLPALFIVAHEVAHRIWASGGMLPFEEIVAELAPAYGTGQFRKISEALRSFPAS